MSEGLGPVEGLLREYRLMLAYILRGAGHPADGPAVSSHHVVVHGGAALAAFEVFLEGMGGPVERDVGARVEPLRAFLEGYRSGYRQGDFDHALRAALPEGEELPDRLEEAAAIFRARMATGGL